MNGSPFVTIVFFKNGACGKDCDNRHQKYYIQQFRTIHPYFILHQ